MGKSLSAPAPVARHGIGQAIALAFARDGAARAVVCWSGVESGADGIVSASGQAAALTGDISVRSDGERAVERSVSRLGTIERLANNADLCEFRPFLEIGDDR